MFIDVISLFVDWAYKDACLLAYSATCGQRNQKKKEKNRGKLAICPDHPRRRIDVKVCMSGGLRCIVLYFIKIGPVVLPLCMDIGLLQCLYYTDVVLLLCLGRCRVLNILRSGFCSADLLIVGP